MIYPYRLDVTKDGETRSETFDELKDVFNFIENDRLTKDQVKLYSCKVEWQEVPLKFTIVKRCKVRLDR